MATPKRTVWDDLVEVGKQLIDQLEEAFNLRKKARKPARVPIPIPVRDTPPRHPQDKR